MAKFGTGDLHGYAVEFSPYSFNRLACVACQNYGIAGSGTVFVVDLLTTSAGPPLLVKSYTWSDGLFDLTWREDEADVIVTGSGDGSIQVWDCKLAQRQSPVHVVKEHVKEIYSVDWSQTRDVELLISGSWDKTIKLWDIQRAQSLKTFLGHEGIVYSTLWSPRVPCCFASASGDDTLRVWDIRSPSSAKLTIPAHHTEILSCDWSKYNDNILMSGGVDGRLSIWDLRSPKAPSQTLTGHQHAIRRIKCSPHDGNIVASCSYDMTTRVWNIERNMELQNIQQHTEYVYGIDFNIHVPGQLCDCSWDNTVNVYNI